MSRREAQRLEREMKRFNNQLTPRMASRSEVSRGPAVLLAPKVTVGDRVGSPGLFLNTSLTRPELAPLLREKPSSRAQRVTGGISAALEIIPIVIVTSWMGRTIGRGVARLLGSDVTPDGIGHSLIDILADNALWGALLIALLKFTPLIARQIGQKYDPQWEASYLTAWHQLGENLEPLDDSLNKALVRRAIADRARVLNSAYFLAQLHPGQSKAAEELFDQGITYFHQYLRRLPDVPLGPDAVKANHLDDELIKVIARQQGARVQARAESLKELNHVIDRLKELDRRRSDRSLIFRARTIYDDNGNLKATDQHATEPPQPLIEGTNHD